MSELEINGGGLPRREFGETGERLSVIGFGGVVVMGKEQDEANRVVAEAVERGVNYFDVAPNYGEGEAEEKLGPALEPYREHCFLACKTHRRDAAGAREDLERSLRRLRTDRFDLYQLHALTDVEQDVEAAFAKGGVMETVLEARREGKIRYVGFSVHTVEAASAALDRFDFDSVLFPLNFACHYKNGFGRQILEQAREQGAARLALKALARQQWPGEDHPDRGAYPNCWYQPLTDRREQELALRFTLSQAVTAAVSPGSESLLFAALEIAANFRPLEDAEVAELEALAAAQNPIFTPAPA